MRATAVLLVLLALSPFTAPFQTFDLSRIHAGRPAGFAMTRESGSNDGANQAALVPARHSRRLIVFTTADRCLAPNHDVAVTRVARTASHVPATLLIPLGALRI